MLIPVRIVNDIWGYHVLFARERLHTVQAIFLAEAMFVRVKGVVVHTV
jgi:hypothetical protein